MSAQRADGSRILGETDTAANGATDREEYVRRRGKRYMAKILSRFEELCEPTLAAQGRTQEIEDFKGFVRQKITALVIDANEVVSLAPGEQINWAAV
jgi:hypothetical protein